MYNMQSMFRRSINNTTMQFEKLGYVANNLSNVNTTGYKDVRFEQMLKEDGYLTGAVRSDFNTQGSFRITGNPYDVAINGAGFMSVVSPQGEIAYTRDGSLKVGKDGYLMTNDEWLVGNGIKVPAGAYKVQIKENGDVVCYDNSDSAEKKLGNIPLFKFDNPEGLNSIENNKLVATEDSGSPILMKNHKSLASNSLETSNVNMYGQVSEMLRLNASMIASMRMMKIVDSMYNKSINIRQG